MGYVGTSFSLSGERSVSEVSILCVGERRSGSRRDPGLRQPESAVRNGAQTVGQETRAIVLVPGHSPQVSSNSITLTSLKTASSIDPGSISGLLASAVCPVLCPLM